MQTYSILIFILVTVAIVAIASNRTRIPVAILLVVAGLLISLMPGLPRVELSPELVLLFVVPPLIYSAGVAMSWREFRYNIRSISLLAFGGVTFTTIAVAAVVHFLLGWDWSIGFVLGAIIAPPDEVAPMAIARRLGMPRRTMVVIEGEGLANDATALILYRFAVAAVSLGTFSFGNAALVFVAIMIGELAWGLVRRLSEPAAAPLGEGRARRDHPLAAHAVRRLLAAGSGRRLRRPRHRRMRPLHQLERPAADPEPHAAAGHLLLGPLHLSPRGRAVPAHRPRSAAAARPRRPGDGGGVRDRRAGDHARDRRRALHVGIPVALSAAAAASVGAAGRPLSDLAAPVPGVVLRRARHRLARRGAGPAAHDGDRHAVSPSRPDHPSDLLGHPHHPRRRGTGAARGAALARPRQDRRTGAEG